LVRCQISLKRILKLSMEWKIICKEEKMWEIKKWLSFFLEEMSLRAIAYSKHFKLSMKNRLPEMKSRIGV
jgi:hypothetical protein